ncbi:zinc finger protein hangover-like [Wyeomyia smithii]|uniref:zinc finger protein hangover-like n=1 Tax=Wyeomyia smithii TaxID=174621 RepID=UPI002467B082|nr:zinc finger protein hangover-like [Wyeomyia smithii]
MDPLMCRLCLTPNSGTVPLFNERTMEPNVLVLQKVVECISIKLNVADDYPSSICSDCLQKLNEWSTFKIQCIVNNDFYRRKQLEMRIQLIKQQATPEVVCLDDEDSEDEQRAEPQPVVTAAKEEFPPQKEVVQVVIDDDEEESQTAADNNGLYNAAQLYYQDDASLDDYELIEGQEVEDPYPTSLEVYPPMDNSAILTSILLDDDESSNSLLEEAEQGMYEKELFGCTFCKRRYSSERKLRTHEKLHSENRMKCLVCGKWIVLQMIRHLRSQHPGQPFPQPVRCWHSKCVHSTVLYYTVDELLAHMETKRRR